jgi:hypothetical protein
VAWWRPAIGSWPGAGVASTAAAIVWEAVDPRRWRRTPPRDALAVDLGGPGRQEIRALLGVDGLAFEVLALGIEGQGTRERAASWVGIAV